MIKINLNETYEATSATGDLKRFTFNSELTDNTIIELHVSITQHPILYYPMFLIWHLNQ